MLKKWLLAVASVVMTIGFALADVDVNKADQAALDGIKGIGPAKSKAILAERAKGGNFKDWADFETRVKGIGEKSAAKLSEAGLTVNGKAKSADTSAKSGPAAAPASAASKASASAAADVASKPKKSKSKDAASK